MSKGLENMVNEMSEKYKRIMVTSDYHIPYMDKKAYGAMKTYAKEYKPDVFVINGDLLDFYSISKFDKSPRRKTTFKEEIDLGKTCLTELKKILPSKTQIIYLEGNHENRLQRYLWGHPEFEGLEQLYLENLLDLNAKDIKFVGVDGDYWKNDTGHIKLGDTFVMHGDNRLNGAKGGMNAAYNTMKSIGNSTIIGHTHRLSHKSHKSPYHNWVAMEAGCLCNHTGSADWQQGFATFELYRGKGVNYQIIPINKGKIFHNGKIYKG